MKQFLLYKKSSKFQVLKKEDCLRRSYLSIIQMKDLSLMNLVQLFLDSILRKILLLVIANFEKLKMTSISQEM